VSAFPAITRYCSGAHVRQSAAVTGKVRGGPLRKRITASDAEQKLLVPVLVLTGVATTTYSSQRCFLQSAVMLNWYPDFVHQAPEVQLGLLRVALIKPA